MGGLGGASSFSLSLSVSAIIHSITMPIELLDILPQKKFLDLERQSRPVILVRHPLKNIREAGIAV